MKKFIIALMCMIVAGGAAMAQPKKSFTFGPKVGVDYTHFWGKDVIYHGGQLNYQAGLFAEYCFNEKFSIAPEVVFAAQGGAYKLESSHAVGVPATPSLKMGGDYSPINIKYTYYLNYINIPVMFKYYVIPQLSIDLGPQLGINIYSKLKEDNDGSKATFDLKDDTQTIDVGVGLGATYNITPEVFVQGRYTMGMTSVFKKSYSDKPKNGNAQIAIGYRF